MKDLVSILIPTYNQEQFIAETLDSVINQTYQDLEIIITDDCSTDGTIEILSRYAATDERIKLLLSEKNQGIPANFNKAFDAVTGEFVAFLGGDDLMLPTKIEKQIKFLKMNQDYGLVQTDLEIFDSKTGETLNLHSDLGEIPKHPLDWAMPIDWHFKKKWAGTFPSSCLARSFYYCSARYRSNFYLKHELFFTVECYLNFPKLKWGIVNETLGKYRVHSNNFSKSDNSTAVIFKENLLLADELISRYPAYEALGINFKKYTLYKNLLFNFLEGQERKYAWRKFSALINLKQKLFFSIGLKLNRIGCLGVYLRLNRVFKVFN